MIVFKRWLDFPIKFLSGATILHFLIVLSRSNIVSRSVAMAQLFVGGLKDHNNIEKTRDDLLEYFQSYGTVDNVRVPEKPDFPGSHKGFAFVTYDPEDFRLEQCLEDSKEHGINGVWVTVREYTEKGSGKMDWHVQKPVERRQNLPKAKERKTE